jgi:hypothetical protein
MFYICIFIHIQTYTYIQFQLSNEFLIYARIHAKCFADIYVYLYKYTHMQFIVDIGLYLNLYLLLYDEIRLTD